MHSKRPSNPFIFATVAVLAVLALGIGLYLARRGAPALPPPDSAAYEETTRAFYRGLASLEVGLLDDARQAFARATDLAPAEPAAWANLGLVHVRLGEFDAAAAPLARAASLASESSDVALLLGQMEIARGRLDEGLAHLVRAVELDPANLRARFALAQEVERSGVPDADTRAEAQLDDLLDRQPDNLVVLLERLRLAARRGNGERVAAIVDRLDVLRETWPPAAMEQYAALQRAAADGNFADTARAVAFLRNVLAPAPVFQENLAAVRTSAELIGEPFVRFLILPSPSARPSPSDPALAFTSQRVGAERPTSWTSLMAFSIDGTDDVAIVAADDAEVRRLDAAPTATPLASGAASAEAATRGLLALDWNYDFRMDLVTAGPDGVRLYLQQENGAFADATAEASRVSGPVTAASVGAWAADIEMDGDLDVVLGTASTAPLVLRNNGDGTWRTLQPFPDVTGARGFAWGDLDRDGDPDGAFLDSRGSLHLFTNRQSGAFAPMAGPAGLTNIVAFTVGDQDADGTFDLVTLDAAGALRRASRVDGGWNQADLAAWGDLPPGGAPGAYRLFLEDVDNNGALDIVASGAGRSAIWLAGADGDLLRLSPDPDAEIFNVVDLDGDGQLDLAGLRQGQAVRLLGRGQQGYHWQVVRTRAQSAAGDQRINSFGVGGEVEVRSGLLVQKQVIAGPVVHFGLGTHSGIDVARILWPNGVMQAEFDRQADQVVVAEQRLKGSCPWVFAHDGVGLRFVTDFLWRSPLGLRINAQDTAGVTQTEDWVRIRGDQLVPREGVYDVRITADLWETHFFDHTSLMVVDHRDEVEVFVDERFAPQAPVLAVHATSPPRAAPRAWDERGRDVTELVAHQDGRYLSGFARGPYQGVAEDHFVEIEVDDEIDPDAPRWLLAHGWIYPTDSSINVAIGQGRRVSPRGLSLEAQDEQGRWIVVSGDLGFPAGKNKTVLIDLRSVARAGVPRARRLRLRTNLEIYWDWLAYADGVDSAELRTTRLQPSRADLRYRGFSETRDQRGDGPEIPSYDRIVSVGQRWRDLVGYYTRYGEVGELLTGVDDRYVIMNAGDELRLEFAAPPPPPPGWTRDFVLIGDGWEKDGDYNTTASKTVQPLPSHSQPEYVDAGEQEDLADDPVYRRHAADWTVYHTRFVTPRDFVSGLRRLPAFQAPARRAVDRREETR